MIYTPPPCDFGSPKKFSAWREGQDKLFWDILDCQTPFSIHNAPVGAGKSPAYMTAAIAQGKRFAVITESKGLQDQLSSDFAEVGLFDMRGLSNYTCAAMAEGGFLEKMWQKRWGRPACDVGPCMSGLRCDLKNAGCEYFDAYRFANGARMVLTNYAYWIAIHKYGQGLGKFDMLIFDECHSAESQLSSALSVEFTEKEFRELGTVPLKIDAPLQNWRMWARVQLTKVTGKLEFFNQSARIGQIVDERGMLILVNDTDIPDAAELRFWKRLEGKCKMVSECSNDWIVEQLESGAIHMAPAFVNEYTDSHLFLGVPRIVMMSGTVRPKTADLLGIPEENRTFVEYPSTFPVERRPIYWLPTVRLSNASTPEDLRTWVVRIDQIIARRQHWKGIVHTRSYIQQQYLLNNSRFRHIMHANKAGNTRDVVKSFRAASTPAVLVSPSVGTGFDFPHDAARYQIISKMPFYDMRSPIIKAQLKQDPDYANYLTSQDLIQLYGRTNRAPEDFSETFIVDDHIEWFLKRYKSFFPEYFLEAFKKIDGVPNPPVLEAA